jgi:hypothetical protein
VSRWSNGAIWWHGPCSKCGTSHGGAHPGTLAGDLACLRAQATKIAPELVDPIDQILEFSRTRIEESLIRAGVIKPTTNTD